MPPPSLPAELPENVELLTLNVVVEAKRSAPPSPAVLLSVNWLPSICQVVPVLPAYKAPPLVRPELVVKVLEEIVKLVLAAPAIAPPVLPMLPENVLPLMSIVETPTAALIAPPAPPAV